MHQDERRHDFLLHNVTRWLVSGLKRLHHCYQCGQSAHAATDRQPTFGAYLKNYSKTALKTEACERR
jgi:hypothetical protein